MRVNDALMGVLFIAVGLAIILTAWQMPEMPGQPYGAATFPIVIGCGFIAVSLALIAKGVAEWREVPGVLTTEWGRSPLALFRMALTVLLVVLYIAFSDALGFTLSSFLVLVTLFLALRVNPIVAVAVAVLATVLIQQAFGVGLRVPLPRSEFLVFLW